MVSVSMDVYLYSAELMRPGWNESLCAMSNSLLVCQYQHIDSLFCLACKSFLRSSGVSILFLSSELASVKKKKQKEKKKKEKGDGDEWRKMRVGDVPS